MRLGSFGIDWKVLAGLAAVAVGVFFFQPRLLTAALPVLLIAACPLSMLLMMWGMRSMSQPAQPPIDSTPLEVEEPLSPHEQITSLRSQLNRLQSAQLAISQQIGSLEASLDGPEPKVAELAPVRPS